MKISITIHSQQILRTFLAGILLSMISIPAMQAQRETEEDEAWEERLEESLQHMEEVLEREHEKLELLHEKFDEEHHQDLELAMAQLEEKLHMKEEELHQLESRIHEQVEKQMAVLEKHLEGMEEHFREAEVLAKQYEKELKDELVRDGLIDDRDDHMNIRTEDDQIYVNGQKLSPEQNRKYKKLFDEFEKKMEKAFRMPKEY